MKYKCLRLFTLYLLFAFVCCFAACGDRQTSSADVPPTTLSSDIDFDEGALLVSFARSAVNGRNVYLAAWNDSGALLGYTTVSGAVLETAVAQLTWHTCEAPEAGTAVYWTAQIPESRALLTLWPEEAVVCLKQNGEQQYFTSGDESLTALLPTPEDALTSQDDAYARETLHSAAGPDAAAVLLENLAKNLSEPWNDPATGLQNARPGELLHQEESGGSLRLDFTYRVLPAAAPDSEAYIAWGAGNGVILEDGWIENTRAAVALTDGLGFWHLTVVATGL